MAEQYINGTFPKGTIDFPSLRGLRSAKSTHRLDQIAHVRAKGVGDHISLPQLVVCGDQSAGKSSVLEGITGIPFPRQDGVCTKFATEIILHHHEAEVRITATVIPHASRSKLQRERFQAYHRVLSDFSELPGVITNAGALMQLRGSGMDDGLTFGEDVLRIEVVGQTGLHLTVVDLPGLISVASEEQTEEDVQLIGRLVDSYLQSSRTIILAVVQANNDIANQGIIQRARKFDRAGQRTVGIITKPDLINKGTEGRIALLAKNLDTTKLKLGYFLLKNPSPAQLEDGITLEERKHQELDFFSSLVWKEHRLDPTRLGVTPLREYLQDLLDGHIERELPKVRTEIKSLLASTEAQLANLGDERPSTAHMRMFLTRRSMEFHGLIQSALDGNYHERDADFFRDHHSTRLRAEVHRLNGSFATEMRENGQKRKLFSVTSSEDGSDQDSDSESEVSPLLVNQQVFNKWVKETYLRTRGRELPGNYNHVLLAELYHEQSSRWAGIAENHVKKLFDITTEFVDGAMDHVVHEENMRREIILLANTRLEEGKALANEELQKLLADEKRQPITYNHYYTDNIQSARESSMKDAMQIAMRAAVEKDWNGKFHVSNTPLELEKVLTSLQKRVIVNMDDQACAEAMGGLQAYYKASPVRCRSYVQKLTKLKVAIKTFVDNVCRQVVERHILSALPNIFAPTTVMMLSEEDLVRIASEPEKQRERRLALQTLAEGLKESLLDLRT
ncbi:related to dynamin GTPase [Rhynchosporium graminicola]|uniref:Related to dynamin GTPase n=1 Tax=Rhynchosporium graminicola TaxID=2792576 RepID=A0A1E1K8D0_9HELO|nr:related to dynamin GTPase [Rhynchosporium commune]